MWPFKTKPKKKKTFKEEFPSLVLIIVGVLAFRSILFEPYKIPTGSMIPTLLIGDYIVVNKFAYGLKVPFVDWFSDPVYITESKHPKRGDIIVFNSPDPTHPGVSYIKRVIGLPGDTIEVIDKVVYVNDIPLKTEEIDGTEIMADMDDKYMDKTFKFMSMKTGEHEHIIQHDLNEIYRVNFSKVTVPEGNFFAMGDNRDYSSDSRVWGPVPFNYIKGEAIFIWFSMTLPFQWPWESEDLDHPLKFRPWRIGKGLN